MYVCMSGMHTLELAHVVCQVIILTEDIDFPLGNIHKWIDIFIRLPNSQTYTHW